jgi:hypothetical protein
LPLCHYFFSPLYSLLIFLSVLHSLFSFSGLSVFVVSQLSLILSYFSLYFLFFESLLSFLTFLSLLSFLFILSFLFLFPLSSLFRFK